jgi:hypothetical protein
MNIKSGEEKTYLIEVKPYKECKSPVNSKNKSNKTKLHEQKT